MKSSELYGCPVIDDSNMAELCQLDSASPKFGRGRLPRDWEANPHGSMPYAASPTTQPIPRSEWKERILDRERAGAVISRLCLNAGMKAKNQQQTNFCWMNAPTQAVEACRVIAGDQHIELSPASGACLVTNYRNVGGWATDAIKLIHETGLVPAKMWAPNAIDRRLDTPESRQERQYHRLSEWVDLPRRNDDHFMTQLILGRPVCIGLDFWGHEVLAMDPFLFPDLRYGTWFGYRFWNSWDVTWGQQGFGILPLIPGKGSPDDAIAPLVASSTGRNSKAASKTLVS